MSRIETTFAALRAKGRKALITFLTAGDPDLQTTHDLVLTLQDAGADIVELGIPFSDPMADGPVIQAASERALKGGASLARVVDGVARLRRRTQIPILLMGYYNPIWVRGLERFCREAGQAGVDAALVVDLPPEESGPLERETAAVGIDLVKLAAPTSGPERLKKIAAASRGFIYYVSLTGITGGRIREGSRIQEQIRRIRQASSLPVAVGFGIATPTQAAIAARFADGVVVGSALVKIVAEEPTARRRHHALSRFVRRLRMGF